MSLELTILGCHSATPRVNAHPTAQYLQINSRHFLIDCGEGTQRQIRKYKVGFSKINHIFISHLHGDHFFGLIGLISTFGILNREKELHVFGPKGIKEVINLQLKYSKSYVKYDLIFHCAGYGQPAKFMKYKSSTYKLNSLTIMNLKKYLCHD